MIVQDKKLISSARVKFIFADETCWQQGETFQSRINDFIKDKNIYDIQYVTDSDGDFVMVVYQVVGAERQMNLNLLELKNDYRNPIKLFSRIVYWR